NILQNIFLFFAVFLFNWGYGQVCVSKDIERIIHNGTYPNVSAVASSIVPSGSPNNTVNTANIIDNNLNTESVFESTSPTYTAGFPSGTLNNGSGSGTITISNLNINAGETVYIKISESDRGLVESFTSYVVKTQSGSDIVKDQPLDKPISYTNIGLEDKRNGIIQFTSDEDFDKIIISYTMSKPAVNTVVSSTQSPLKIGFYGIYVNPLCEPISCNEIIPVTNKYFGGSISVDTNNVDSKNNIIDADETNYGLMTVGVLLGITVDGVVQINKSSNFTPGSYIGFDLTQNNLLTAASSVSFKIETLNSNNQIQETYNIPASSALITLGTSSSKILGFKTDPSKPFSSFRLTAELEGILGTYTFNINHGFVMEPCSTINELICNSNTPITTPSYGAIISGERTGVSSTSGSASLADIGSAILNPENVVDNDPNNYASISSVASLGGKYNLSVKTPFQNLNATDGNSTYVGFDLETSSLIGLSLLNDIVINLYNNGNLVDTSLTDDVSLIDLTLATNNSRSIIGFVTDKEFNEAQIEIKKSVSVDIGNTKIYNLIVRKLCEGPDLTCNQRTILDDSIYPISISGNTGVEGLLSLGSVTEPRNAIDNDPTTYASMNILAGALSKATLAIKKSLSPYPANTYVSFEVENSSLLDLSVLSNYTIRLLRNGTQVGIAEGNNLLIGANILQGSRQNIGYKAPAEFDEIQFIIDNTGLSVDLGITNVYNVKVMKPCAVLLNCDEEFELTESQFPVVINSLRTGPTSAACVTCEVRNPQNLISGNPNNYATLTIPVGLLSGVSVSVEDLATVYPAGTRVGFTINDASTIIQLDLLESLQITTYLNGVAQETASAAELLDLSLIFNITGTGIKNYGFQTSLPFDEIQLTAFSLLNVVNNIHVYNLRIDTKNSSGEGLACIGNPFAEDDTFTLYPGQTSTTSVVDNDVSNNSPAVIGQNVQISQISSSNPDIILNSNGQVVVGANVLPGIYQLEYRICNIDSPSSCDTAIIQVIVKGINDIDGDGIPDDIDLDNDNDGILDSDECFSINHISSSGNGNFPKSLGNVDQTNQWITSNNWIVGGNYALSGDWTEASGRGRINFGINGLSFLRDNNTTTSLSKTDITSNLNGAKITFNNVKWLYTLPNNGTQENSNSDRSFVLQVYVRGVHYMNILSGNGTENGPVIQTLNGASTNVTNLASYLTLPTDENHNTWSPSQSIILSLPISGVPSDQLSSTDFELRFLAGASITRVRDLAIESISLESCRDLDNDELQDYLDTDSDNDGCLDAIEGGDNVKPEQLKANGQINSPVDATGVPTLVNDEGAADIDNLQGQSTNNGKPYNAADTSECPTFCVKPGDRSTNGTPSIIGISTLSKQLQTWPENIPNGFIALESKEKGFVITTVNNVNTILDPKPGMIVYDNSEGAKCIKLYSNSGPGNTYQWKCIERTCNQ
ncbi:MAG: hypothetical protein KIG88_02610, partial [Weeksellaceae bacterium]|nr:hypothetical protein [Weeksellaceae bacterium]